MRQRMQRWMAGVMGVAMLGLAGVLVPMGCSSESPAKREQPLHVLLIVIDTLRADHLSCYGYWRETSPNIDAMAKRGVKFTGHIAQSSWTVPSMVTMMTGQRLRGPRLIMPLDHPTLAELFKDAGFKTGAWVANQLLTPNMGFARGYDRYTGEAEWHSTKPPGRLDGILEWFEETKDEDSFTWVHFTDPHDPYVPPTDVRTGLAGKLSEYQEQIIAEAAASRSLGDSIPNQSEYITREVGLYDDEIIAVDRKVRQLLLSLQENGGLENTIVVLTSDHGETLWERPESAGRVASQDKHRGGPAEIQHLLKQTHGDFVYQELVNVPLIIMAPGLERGQVIDTVGEAVHLPSTILKLAGVEVEGVGTMVGRDLFGMESGAGAYTMTKLGEAFISADGWKLILPSELGASDFGQSLQLYDLNTDPRELVNLAEKHPKKIGELTALMKQRRDSAIPTPTMEQHQAQVREQMKLLEDIGYVGQGVTDGLDEDGDEESSPH